MLLDVEDLRDFYATPLGHVVRRLLARQIRARWQVVRGQVVLGLGFASPYLGIYRHDALRLGALMPGGQGALVWPAMGPTRSVLVDEVQLPLPDNCVDKLLVVHCIEAAGRPAPLLREMWRVLAPEGSLMLIVPNRRGVWARFDRTPFGQGRPYSRGQLEQLLTDAMFTPVAWGNALHMPPIARRRLLLGWAPTLERIGARLSPGFGGVIIVEAKKELIAPIGKVVRARASTQMVQVPARGSAERARGSAERARGSAERARGSQQTTISAHDMQIAVCQKNS